LINKTFKQLNAERAGWRAWRANLSPGKKKKRNKSASSQAGGPAHQAPSGKINYFKKKFDKDLKIG